VSTNDPLESRNNLDLEAGKGLRNRAHHGRSGLTDRREIGFYRELVEHKGRACQRGVVKDFSISTIAEKQNVDQNVLPDITREIREMRIERSLESFL